MAKQEPPISFRVNDEDKEVLVYLQRKLGLKLPQIIKLAIRRLRDEELRRDKK
jgi:hypothetical protein